MSVEEESTGTSFTDLIFGVGFLLYVLTVRFFSVWFNEKQYVPVPVGTDCPFSAVDALTTGKTRLSSGLIRFPSETKLTVFTRSCCRSY